MVSDEVPLNICTRFVDQICGESGENMCGRCKMEARLELLINNLNSSQLIIKILQEEIKVASTSPRNQDNFSNLRSINPMMNQRKAPCMEGNSTHQSNGCEAQEVYPHRSNG
jgi:hypothetical protein